MELEYAEYTSWREDVSQRQKIRCCVTTIRNKIQHHICWINQNCIQNTKLLVPILHVLYYIYIVLLSQALLSMHLVDPFIQTHTHSHTLTHQWGILQGADLLSRSVCQPRITWTWRQEKPRIELPTLWLLVNQHYLLSLSHLHLQQKLKLLDVSLVHSSGEMLKCSRM